MSEPLVVNALEQLKPFLNDKNVLELVIRQKNQRIKAFQKIVLNNCAQEEAGEGVKDIAKALNKNVHLADRNFDLLNAVINKNNLGLILNGANLCATCAGFAIMYAKLDQLEEQIGKQINQLHNDIKKKNDVETDFEFKKVLAEHTDMLDSRRRQKAYSEEKMRELVDREYNVLDMLIHVFNSNISSDREAVVVSMFSLLSMLTVSLLYFDEVYYENNHEVLKNKDVWHSSHEKWMSAYSTLLSKKFVEDLQDYAVFETNFNTLGVDVYCASLIDQVKELRQDVIDNQQLILRIGDSCKIDEIKRAVSADAKAEIDAVFKVVNKDIEGDNFMTDYHEALQQAALA